MWRALSWNVIPDPQHRALTTWRRIEDFVAFVHVATHDLAEVGHAMVGTRIATKLAMHVP